MSHHAPNFSDTSVSHQAHTEVHTSHVIHKGPHPNKKSSRMRPWRTIGCGAAFLLFFFIVATMVFPARAGYVAYNSATHARQLIIEAREYVAAGSYENAAMSIAQSRMQLNDARTSLGEIGFWRNMPGIGTQIRALEDAISAADQGLDAVYGMLEAFGSIAQAFRANAYAEIDPQIAAHRSYADLSVEEKREVLRKLAASIPAMRVAREKATLAVELWKRVPQDRLIDPLVIALKPLADGLPAMKDVLDRSIPLIEAGLPFAGYPGKMRFLLLFQNSDELRPTGGFIGSIATVTMDGGDMKELNFADVYSLDNAVTGKWKDVPPAVLTRELGVKTWFFRDGNWSPDFPTSAAHLLDVFHRETALAGIPGEAPTAIIATTPAFFKNILALTGPVRVGNEVYDANNFFDKIEYQVEQGFLQQGTKLDDRKAVLGTLGEAVMDKLKQLPSSRWGEILHVIDDAFERKQMQAFAEDPKILALLDTNIWTGRTKPTLGDFLWTVDANLAALKTDGVMKKKVMYQIDAKNPNTAPLATVTLEYTNTNKKIDWRYTRYRSYTRIYVPEGSELVDSKGGQGATDVFRELGKTVFASFWVVEPGATRTLTFTYRLPQEIAAQITSGIYRLDWPKQAGADETQLTLDLKFGKNIKTAEPAEARETWGDMTYQFVTDSLNDRVFRMTFTP